MERMLSLRVAAPGIQKVVDFMYLFYSARD